MTETTLPFSLNCLAPRLKAPCPKSAQNTRAPGAAFPRHGPAAAAKSGRSAARASKTEHAGARRFRIERGRQAEPKDLREVVKQPHRGPQHRGILGLEQRRAAPPFPASRAVDVSRISGVAAACISCRYCAMNSISTSAAGGVFEVPRIGVALFLGDGRAHFDDVVGDRCAHRACGRARRGSTLSILAAKSGGPETTRARVSAMCSQVHASRSW